jgi:hypothetical protein
MPKNNIEFEDYTEDYLIEDGALYLVDSAIGISAVYGNILDEETAEFVFANDPYQECSFDDTPDRIVKLNVPQQTTEEKDND